MDNAKNQPTARVMPLADRVTFYGNILAGVIARAEADGVILTVERVSKQPLAMGNHKARVTAWASIAARTRENEVRSVIVGAQ